MFALVTVALAVLYVVVRALYLAAPFIGAVYIPAGLVFEFELARGFLQVEGVVMTVLVVQCLRSGAPLWSKLIVAIAGACSIYALYVLFTEKEFVDAFIALCALVF